VERKLEGKATELQTNQRVEGTKGYMYAKGEEKKKKKSSYEFLFLNVLFSLISTSLTGCSVYLL